MVFLEYTFDMTKKVLITNFVCRNFKIRDKVNVFFKGKFYNGEIVKKEIDLTLPSKAPYITIKTHEKVGNDKDLLQGYGLRGPIYGRDPTFFEDEPLPEGDEIYKKIFERPITKKEIEDEMNDYHF